jgi:uncharacterized membrane protein
MALGSITAIRTVLNYFLGKNMTEYAEQPVLA